MRVDFFVTPLDIGSGTALPATITYKRQEGASETQVRVSLTFAAPFVILYTKPYHAITVRK